MVALRMLRSLSFDVAREAASESQREVVPVPAGDRAAMAEIRAVDLPSDVGPLLLTVVHTEEEFDWSAPFDRAATAITHLRQLERAQEIFARHGARPIYMVDYCVAAQEAGVAVLRPLIEREAAAVGAHLHPWVNPPFEETVSPVNSYPGNLPPALEREKLRLLTERIVQSFAVRPLAYLAGRYGFGPHSLSILQELGYRLDLSTVAFGDFRSDGGPDYRSRDNCCRWEGSPAILRIPHSVADIGFLCRDGKRLVEPEGRALLRSLHLPGVMARLGAIQRIRLSPEGFSLPHLRAAARALVAAGLRVLVFSFHSPSLAPGFTPYVRDRTDLSDFLARVDGFLRFFRQEIGGEFCTPVDLLNVAA